MLRSLNEMKDAQEVYPTALGPLVPGRFACMDAQVAGIDLPRQRSGRSVGEFLSSLGSSDRLQPTRAEPIPRDGRNLENLTRKEEQRLNNKARELVREEQRYTDSYQHQE